MSYMEFDDEEEDNNNIKHDIEKNKKPLSKLASLKPQEIEMKEPKKALPPKLKNDRNKVKDDFKKPLLDVSDGEWVIINLLIISFFLNSWRASPSVRGRSHTYGSRMPLSCPLLF